MQEPLTTPLQAPSVVQEPLAAPPPVPSIVQEPLLAAPPQAPSVVQEPSIIANSHSLSPISSPLDSEDSPRLNNLKPLQVAPIIRIPSPVPASNEQTPLNLLAVAVSVSVAQPDSPPLPPGPPVVLTSNGDLEPSTNIEEGLGLVAGGAKPILAPVVVRVDPL
jgi:hypothetical protein